jgi:hypothetical protein
MSNLSPSLSSATSFCFVSKNTRLPSADTSARVTAYVSISGKLVGELTSSGGPYAACAAGASARTANRTAIGECLMGPPHR